MRITKLCNQLIVISSFVQKLYFLQVNACTVWDMLGLKNEWRTGNTTCTDLMIMLNGMLVWYTAAHSSLRWTETNNLIDDITKNMNSSKMRTTLTSFLLIYYSPVLWLMLYLPHSVPWCMNRQWHLGWLLLVLIQLLQLMFSRTPVFFTITITDCHTWYDILPLPCWHSPGWCWLRTTV